MKTYKIESFDFAIRDAKSMFDDFIFFLKEKIHLEEKIVDSLEVSTHRWTERDQERCRIELIINWSSLGLIGLELDHEDCLERVTRSCLLVNFFKKSNKLKDHIEDVDLSASIFGKQSNIEMREIGGTTICRDEKAVPIWRGDQWFHEAFCTLQSTFKAIEESTMKNRMAQNINPIVCDTKSNLQSALLSISSSIRDLVKEGKRRRQVVEELRNKIEIALSAKYINSFREESIYTAVVNLAFRLVSPDIPREEGEVEEVSVYCFGGSFDLEEVERGDVLKIDVREGEHSKYDKIIAVNLNFADTSNVSNIKDYLTGTLKIATEGLEDGDVKDAWITARKNVLSDAKTFFMDDFIDAIDTAQVKGIEAISRRVSYKGVDMDACCVIFSKFENMEDAQA